EVDPRPYRHALEQAEGQLMRDQALLRNATLDLERYKRLTKGNFISLQQVDTQESLVQQHRGSVKIDEAQVESARLNLDYCRITAPASGRVGLRQVDLGNYTQPGDATGLAVLTQLQPITVVFPLAEDNVPRVMRQIGEGKRLAVIAYDRSGRRKLAEGMLATVDNQVDPTTGTVKLKASFANRDHALFPNQFVNIRLIVETIKDAVVIPASGVQYGPKGAFAYVVSQDGTAIPTAIEVGPTEGENAVILSGLAARTRIVVAGADRLRSGARVRAVEE
ncbi:MAG: efflux RND transporter periplasmic adaptor subunit, partial [Alphaproteobacteria bacterium]|nr:efflux RND transporter periplasmic adaptor subunit [Alphaproteobacteria bacterium]